jgi:hypothetical protein
MEIREHQTRNNSCICRVPFSDGQRGICGVGRMHFGCSSAGFALQNRIADAITRFAGSMMFVYFHIGWFAVWIILGIEGYPFGLLTMIVSLEAIFLSTFVMISQNRADAKRNPCRSTVEDGAGRGSAEPPTAGAFQPDPRTHQGGSCLCAAAGGRRLSRHGQGRSRRARLTSPTSSPRHARFGRAEGTDEIDCVTCQFALIRRRARRGVTGLRRRRGESYVLRQPRQLASQGGRKGTPIV